MSRFQVGDRVRVTDGPAAHDSYSANVATRATGVIERDDTARDTWQADNCPLKVRFDHDNDTWWMHPRHLEAVSVSQSTARPSVGDRVKILSSSEYSEYVGETGKLVEDDGTPRIPLRVVIDGDGDDWGHWFRRGDVVLAPEVLKIELPEEPADGTTVESVAVASYRFRRNGMVWRRLHANGDEIPGTGLSWSSLLRDCPAGVTVVNDTSKLDEALRFFENNRAGRDFVTSSFVSDNLRFAQRIVIDALAKKDAA